MSDKLAADEETSSVVIVTPVEGSEKGDAADSQSKSPEQEDGEKKSEESEEKVIVGMVCGTKDLYQKWDQNQPNKFTWTEKYPEDLEEAAENAETMKFAILVRNKKSYDSRKKLEIDSIVIQSPLIKKVLHDVLEDYPGVTTTMQRLAFSAPFRPFVHRWAELTSALTNDEYDEATRAHVKLLHDILSVELDDVIEAMKDYRANKVVTYEHVWTIFQPGCIVLASRYGHPIAMRLEQGQYVQHCRLGPVFQLTCDRVDWDGSKFGYDEAQQLITPFLGTMPIEDLACCPLQYSADPEGMKEMLVARGRLFESLAGYHYKMYVGQAIEQKKWGPSKISVESRIVIDAFAHGKWNPNHQSSLKSLNKVQAARAAQLDAEDGGDYNVEENYSYDDYGERREEELIEDLKPVIPLTEEQLLLCTPMLKGWALKSKKWLEFYVDSVSEVCFNDRAFDSLVLPRGQKSLILAFARSQAQNKDKIDDVIAGKGKGIIMLLSGGPGIGKTLTAEAVAEEMQVPLYVMSADDLGQTSWDVEMNLLQVLEMVAKWNAVLLLDECDIVLERRTSTDLDRNRIVGIFLRTLEYYEGILFLTTNRVDCMDEAFQSRIHLSLEYPPLNFDARRTVWTGFLERQDADERSESKHTVTSDDIERLARLELNGRQIRNVLKTSNLLAFHQGEKLGFDHLKTVLEVEGRKLDV
ncbi:hypothetical protein MCOR27_006928 [Pyricularia oryzae]|uniref:AAA+ ATPase domain-containing protein n=3 Tax=Pyricularia TaxID=48558 RepID=A0ABQ8NCC0_PYRGI|nr:uncharacterized protein MGG_04085 [Pyricularia oryzae 70-15]ELQ35776.1 hypothetical protein OOU_Y34scaffold00689g9 [Pyricularia oryzae Y34]KAH8845891.1 hypothetical protein MCOR01_003114 [Pyricularia oryzae]KAI6294780.1 hypothetical protein MCOR33_008175 [Pyricularia grisea]EHA47386.1 hypothetical protein MGG_04085 [Pyricularia oryzae 70-15]KAH9432602.1 hypothetical protein MCOR02_007292 [Pyricularia oryzae]